jgi:hypothetical protein
MDRACGRCLVLAHRRWLLNTSLATGSANPSPAARL